jgi:hypothetical protein
MTVAEIATAILLAEAVLAAVRWAMNRQAPAAEQPAPIRQFPGYGGHQFG